MADWYGAARTNYFPVKDAEVFQAWARASSLHAFKHDASDLWGVYSEDQFGGWPNEFWDDDDVEPREFDIVAELARHVPDGWPVVLIEAGAEKLRCITGHAVAFRVCGGAVERIALSLDDIHEMAAERWGVAPTRCSW